MSDYDEQLHRAMAETPEGSGDGERFALPAPEVRQEGNATVYENYRETVGRLGREPGVVLKCLQDELGTSAHIDERGRARLTGQFTASRVGDAIESFAAAFVRCPECGRPDTRLVDDDGNEQLKCDACGALSTPG